MTGYERTFEISNPSPYERSDYVQIHLDKLGVPLHLGDRRLTLYRLKEDGSRQEVPYQIDYPFGRGAGSRVISFFCVGAPAGKEDYSNKVATFCLCEKEPRFVILGSDRQIGYYHTAPVSGEPPDGFSWQWNPQRSLNGVKLFNGAIEIYFSLAPSLLDTESGSLAGSATSVLLRDSQDYTGAGEMLSPFWECSDKRWGQVSQLVFYPLPWEHKRYHTVDLRSQEYQLVWAQSGPIRAIVSLKSTPFTITYDGSPFFGEHKETLEIKAHLYRVIYVYHAHDRPYYTEELFVLTEKGHRLLSFRPYYFSKILPETVITELKRFEHIPDYFAVWKHYGPLYRGYGFAADVHVRWVKISGDEIHWRLPLNQNCKCIHYFMFEPSKHFDPFHIIGHRAWYEGVFKPLKPHDLSLGFPLPLEYEE